MASLKLETIDKVFPNGVTAVRGLNLQVSDGELVVLVGPSGCGKTTILRLIAGLEIPSAGRVFLDNQDVTDWASHQRDLAMVFQSYALYPHKTVRANLAFNLRMRRTPAGVIAERVATAAQILGLEDLLERFPGQLSGGQRQRVALGRAIVRAPRAFLLDEPLSNLDAQLRVQTRSELARLQRRLGATILHVTHDQEEAMVLGDRVGVLREGVLQQLAPPLEIYRRPVNLFVAGFIGSPAMNFFEGEFSTVNGTRSFTSPWFTFPVQGQPTFPDHKKIVLGVRPQEILPVDPALADVVGRVEVIQHLGSALVAHVRLKGEKSDTQAAVHLPSETKLAVNDPLGMRIPQDKIHWFDAGSGARLGQE